MSSIKAISDGAGGYIYPVTIADAIIDPQTGLPAQLGGGSEVAYKINNSSADSNGNFSVTAASVGAAPANHTHAQSDITGLPAALTGKSDSDHTHNYVTGLIVGGSTVHGMVQLVGTGNISAEAANGVITLTVTPYTADVAQAITDTNDNVNYNVFVGTEDEWETFKSTSMPANSHYIVYLRS